MKTNTIQELIHESPLSNHNRKYGPEIFHFTLPRDTCSQYRTSLCNKHCYGKRYWWNVLQRYKENYQDSLQESFVNAVNQQIRKESIKYVRIHPVGDFYNQPYFEKWISIIKANSECNFLAFTRNHELIIDEIPNNLELLFSIDRCSENLPDWLQYCRIALLFEPPKSMEGKFYPHLESLQVSNSPFLICANRCEDCRFCWHGIKNIAFPLQTGPKVYKKVKNPKNNTKR